MPPPQDKNFQKTIVILIFVLSGTGMFCMHSPMEVRSDTMFQTKNERISEITLFSVYDNYQLDPALKTGWGYGVVVKTPNDRILFDTGGDSEILLFNMKKMNIDPHSIDKVVISHVHADHLGGLKGFLERNSDVTVFIPSSFPNAVRNLITGQGAEFVDVSAPQKIADSIFSTGELNGPPMEQSLVVNSGKGLIVITGCAHPGIITIVKKAKEMFSQQKVFLVMGGFHQPFMGVTNTFRELGVESVAPSHCTGDQVINAFRKEYREDFTAFGVGKIIEIDTK